MINYNVDGNGCGAVAIHNVKVLKNKESTLSETIKDVQMNMGLVFNGCFGVNPYRVDTILKKSGLTATPITIDDMNRSGVYLLAYWNSENIRDGAHFVAVQYDGKSYTTFNGEKSNPQEYAKRLICGYYVE